VKSEEPRNRVWQFDFFEFETTGGGIWRLGGSTTTTRSATDPRSTALGEASLLDNHRPPANAALPAPVPNGRGN
jgi:hypothetical protein